MGNERGGCRVALFSCTLFGQLCLEKGILPCPDINLVGIVTTPTSVTVGSGNNKIDIASPSRFEFICQETGCELVTFEKKPRANDYLGVFDRWKPDLLLILGWYYLIPETVLSNPSVGSVAIHASLLPQYRGMAPIPWAIINGEKETGVTLFYPDNTVDGGDIISQSTLTITNDDDCATVYAKATERSIELLREYLPLLADKTAPRQKQENSSATQFPRRTPEDGLINWNQPATKIYDFIRAQTRPYPGAFTWMRGRKIHVWRGMAVPSSAQESQPGEIIIQDGHTDIATGNGNIRILESDLEGEASGDKEKCWLINGSICGMSSGDESYGNEKGKGCCPAGQRN